MIAEKNCENWKNMLSKLEVFSSFSRVGYFREISLYLSPRNGE
jgi:hypothetical protein